MNNSLISLICLDKLAESLRCEKFSIICTNENKIHTKIFKTKS